MKIWKTGLLPLIAIVFIGLTAWDNTTTVPCASGHVYSVFVSTTATCTAAGQDTYKCSRCDDTEQRERAALGHLVPNSVPATCTTDGNTGTGTCAREGCNQTFTGEVIPALGHDFNGTWVKDAGGHWKV